MPSHRVRLRTAGVATGVATDHPSRAGTAGWRAAGTTVHATLAQAGVSFRGALGLGPSRGQHLRTELLAGAAWVPGNLVLHVHGSGQSPRTCVHPENRVAPMERNRGLMGRPDRRMGQTCSKRTGRDRTRNRTVHIAGRGPARAERAAVASMGSWSRRGMPSGETPARPRPPYVRWCPARAKGPPASTTSTRARRSPPRPASTGRRCRRGSWSSTPTTASSTTSAPTTTSPAWGGA